MATRDRTVKYLLGLIHDGSTEGPKTLRDHFVELNKVTGMYWILTAFLLVGADGGDEALVENVKKRFAVKLNEELNRKGLKLSENGGLLRSLSAVQLSHILRIPVEEGIRDQLESFFTEALREGHEPFWLDQRGLYCLVSIMRLTNNMNLLTEARKRYLVTRIENSQSVLGGFGAREHSEPHSGYTFCAVAALKLLDAEIPRSRRLTAWLTERLRESNGRPGKPRDSCYLWWNAASLINIGRLHIVEQEKESIRMFLNEHCFCQDTGGFSKFPSVAVPGEDSSVHGKQDPDLFHTFLSVACLALLEGFKWFYMQKYQYMTSQRIFRSANECITALKNITSTPALLSQSKTVYNDILSEAIPFVRDMTPSDVRIFSKSVVVINRKFQLNLNNYLFKVMNNRMNDFIETEISATTRHALVSTMSSLSQVVRQVHDGGPPALRPDTVWKFAHAKEWRSVWREGTFDKCEMLSVLSRLNIRPSDSLVYTAPALDAATDESAVYFSSQDIEALRLCDPRQRANGRICGSVFAMSSLGLSGKPSFPALLQLLLPRLDELSAMELVNVAHAIAVRLVLTQQHLDETLEDLLVACLRRAQRRKRELSISSMNQIAVIHFGLLDNASYREKLRGNPALEAFVTEAMTSSESDSVNIVKTSKAQKVITNALIELGLEEFFEEEFSVGPFRADVAFPALRLLIEINGPYHHYYKSSDPTARTVYKQRSLESRGFRILNIDYLEMKDETNRVRLMESRLRQILGLESGKQKLRSEIIRLLANR